MEEMLRDLVLVFFVAGTVLAAFHQLRLPGIVGLLIAGVLIGPSGFGILRDRSQIENLAELGILLLMFSIGLDFTRDRLHELARAAGMGVAQILICVVVTAVASVAFVERWAEAVLFGLLVSHTSSTLMLKLFLDRGELSSPQVRLGLGISITQDLSALPMLLAIPMMAGGGNGSLIAFGFDLLKVLGVLASALVLARWVVPQWLHQVVRSRSRELFLMFLVVISLGTAWITIAVGLSGAMGAFLAGLAIASSAYSHQTLAEVTPIRDLLISLFFISIGMLIQIESLLEHSLTALALIPLILILKFLSGFLPVLAWGYPLRIATLVGVGIAQIGEFSFVVAHGGREAGLLPDESFQFFVLLAILTMLVNPFLVAAGPKIQGVLGSLSWLRRFEARQDPEADFEAPTDEHYVVIAGYGLNGKTVTRALKTLEVPHLALDLNPDAVRMAQERGESVIFGDATRIDVLQKARLEQAETFVVAISDPQATRQTVQIARHLNPGLHIIARTKYLAEIERLRALGADVVISEEFETSLEILARVLHSFDVPRLRIEEIVQHFRGESYEAFRGPLPLPKPELLSKVLPSLQIESAVIQQGSPADGKTLQDLNLRAQTGTTLLAVQREGTMQTNPPSGFQLRANDVVVLCGTTRQILDAVRLLEEPEEPASEEPPMPGTTT